LDRLAYSYGRLRALGEISTIIERNEIVGILGPNGSGKTTLLRILSGILKGWEGQVDLFGKPLDSWRQRDLARQVVYLPQQVQLSFPYTSREVVLMGRLPHQGGSFFESAGDSRIVEEALRRTGCLHLQQRYCRELSGGERQLVSLASSLAQEPRVLLLDEPTVFLDLRHQLQIGRILRELNTQSRITLIIVTHDLNLARALCDRLLFLKAGHLVSDFPLGKGSGRVPIPAALIEEVFDVRAFRKEMEGSSQLALLFDAPCAQESEPPKDSQ